VVAHPLCDASATTLSVACGAAGAAHLVRLLIVGIQLMNVERISTLVIHVRVVGLRSVGVLTVHQG